MYRLVTKTVSQYPAAVVKSPRCLQIRFQSSSNGTLRPPRPGKAAELSEAHGAATINPSSEPVPKKVQVVPEIIFYHNPAVLRSVKTLALLRDAQTAFPRTKFRIGPPLELKIEVLERLPTIEELQEMFNLITEPSWTIFRAHDTPHNYRHHITGVRSLMNAIEHERQEKLAGMPQNDAAVKEPPPSPSPPPPPSPASAAADSPAPTSSATPSPRYEVAVLDASHPLFGTDGFAWPVMICWAKKMVKVFPQTKEVHRLLKDLANERDDIVVKTKEQLKEEATEAWQATWTYPEKQVPPDEDDTLKWFNESGKEPVKKRTW